MANNVGNEEEKNVKPDFLKLFPVHSIKRYLQSDPDVGRMTKETEELLVSCAATFLETLLKDSIGMDKVVTLDNLKQTVAANDKFHFLNLESVHDSTAPAIKKRKSRSKKVVSKATTTTAMRKKARVATSLLLDVNDEEELLKTTAVADAVAPTNSTSIGSLQEGIQLNEDDDEYD